jgi:glutathione S-transferase
MTITVHHLEKSRSQRVLWLLEELGLEYELKEYKRDKTTMLAPPELKKVHPLGKSPIVTDDGGPPLAESGAILEYLVDKYGKGKLIPKEGTPDYRRYKYWMHYAEGSAMPPLLLKLIFETIKKKTPWPVKPIGSAIANKVLSDFVHPQLKLHFDWIESELGKSEWIAGNEITAADMQMLYPLEAFAARGIRQGDDGSYSNIKKYLARVHERPAYMKAVERGGTLEMPS